MSKPARAKRANKANPRTDRNNKGNKVVNFSGYQRKTKVEILPRNLNQEIFLENLNDDRKDICFGIGPAGSGKTLIATLTAIKMMKEGQIDKIVITRPNVAVDDSDIGHLPGSLLEKMMPWIRPVFDIFQEYYSPAEITNMIEEGVLEICPVAHIRGRTFKNAFVLLDEAQNMSINAMKSALTRIGDNTKMVVTGDIKQSDKKDFDNGLVDFLDRFENSDRITVTKFEVSDVERSLIVREVLKIYGE